MNNSEIEEFLNISLDELTWQDLSICSGVKTELFFEGYESDEMTANMVDEMCLSCPVLAACAKQGVMNNEWGVWGGVFLSNGKMDEKKNAHKTPETWDELRSRLSE